MTGSRYLADGERLVVSIRRHPVALAGPALLALAALIAASVLGWLTGPDETGTPIDVVVGMVALAVVARLAWKMWQWSADRIMVTDRRFLLVSGVLTRKVAAMPLSKVTDMTYRRSLLGRVLGYGELVVESAGQDQGLSRLDRIPRPDDFYRTVTALSTSTLPEPEPEAVAHSWTGWAKSPEEEDTGPLPRVIV